MSQQYSPQVDVANIQAHNNAFIMQKTTHSAQKYMKRTLWFSYIMMGFAGWAGMSQCYEMLVNDENMKIPIEGGMTMEVDGGKLRMIYITKIISSILTFLQGYICYKVASKAKSNFDSYTNSNQAPGSFARLSQETAILKSKVKKIILAQFIITFVALVISTYFAVDLAKETVRAQFDQAREWNDEYFDQMEENPTFEDVEPEYGWDDAMMYNTTISESELEKLEKKLETLEEEIEKTEEKEFESWEDEEEWDEDLMNEEDALEDIIEEIEEKEMEEYMKEHPEFAAGGASMTAAEKEKYIEGLEEQRYETNEATVEEEETVVYAAEMAAKGLMGLVFAISMCTLACCCGICFVTVSRFDKYQREMEGYVFGGAANQVQIVHQQVPHQINQNDTEAMGGVAYGTAIN